MPTINGLTQRLSELLPNLEKHFSPDGEALAGPVEEIIADIKEVGHHEVNMYEELGLTVEIEDGRNRKSMETARKVGVGSQNSIANDETRARSSTASFATARPYSANQGIFTPSSRDLNRAFARLPSGRLRSLSDSDVDWAMTEQASGFRLASRHSLTHMRLDPNLESSPENRPWNLACSYPWSNSIPFIDIHFPSPSPANKSGSPASLFRAASPSPSDDDSISALIVPPVAIAPNRPTASPPPGDHPTRRLSIGTSNKILNTLSLHRRAVAPISSARHSRRNSRTTNPHHRASTIRASSNTTVGSLPTRAGYASSHAGSGSAVLDVAKAVGPGR